MIPDGWKRKKMIEFCEMVTRKNKGKCSRVLTASGQQGLIDQKFFFNKSVAGKNLEKYYLLKRGEYAYNRSSMKEYPFGAIKRLNNYDEGAISTLYICFKITSEDVNTDYYSYYVDSGLLNNQLSRITQVGARAHGLLNITYNEFINTSILLPTIPEQKKIVEIFTSVDVAIQSTQAVIEQTKKVKQGLFQELMERGIGHVRFKKVEFNEQIVEIPAEWEVKNLAEIGAKEKYAIVDGPFGSNLKTEHYRTSGIPVIQSGFVTSGLFLPTEYVYISRCS